MPLTSKKLEEVLQPLWADIANCQKQVEWLARDVKALSAKSAPPAPIVVPLPPTDEIRSTRREMRAMFFTMLPFAILACLGTVVLVLQVATIISRIVLRG